MTPTILHGTADCLSMALLFCMRQRRAVRAHSPDGASDFVWNSKLSPTGANDSVWDSLRFSPDGAFSPVQSAPVSLTSFSGVGRSCLRNSRWSRGEVRSGNIDMCFLFDTHSAHIVLAMDLGARRNTHNHDFMVDGSADILQSTGQHHAYQTTRIISERVTVP